MFWLFLVLGKCCKMPLALELRRGRSEMQGPCPAAEYPLLHWDAGTRLHPWHIWVWAASPTACVSSPARSTDCRDPLAESCPLCSLIIACFILLADRDAGPPTFLPRGRFHGCLKWSMVCLCK